MSSETNGDKKSLKQPGLYRHPGTGAEVYISDTPGIGTPMIDAYIRAGFVKVEATENKPVVDEDSTSAEAEPSNAELKAQLLEMGADEKEISKFNKTQLKEKIAELSK